MGREVNKIEEGRREGQIVPRLLDKVLRNHIILLLILLLLYTENNMHNVHKCIQICVCACMRGVCVCVCRVMSLGITMFLTRDIDQQKQVTRNVLLNSWLN